MKAFNYKGYRQGQLIAGLCYADTAAQARAYLKTQQMVCQSVRINHAYSRPPSASQIIDLLHHLQTLLAAGMPMLSALSVLLSDRTLNASLHGSVLAIQSALTQGQRLSEALKAQPSYYPSLLCGLVAAGEQSGYLTQCLAQGLSHYRYALSLQAKIKKALFYPSVVFGVCLMIVGLLLLTIVPRFEALFLTLDVSMPWFTRALIHLSHLIQSPLVIAGVLLCCLGMVYRQMTNRASPFGVKKRLPFLHRLQKQAMLAQFSYTLSQLLEAGLTLQDSLALLESLFPDADYQRACSTLPGRLQQGQRFSEAMAEIAWFPPLMCQHVHIGEQSGTLTAVFSLLFNRYDAQVKTQSERYLKLLEPIMMVGIGGFIALIMLALYWPIFHIGQAL